MNLCLFVSDLHGSIDKFEKLFSQIRLDSPRLVLLGGDLLPFGGVLANHPPGRDPHFITGFLSHGFAALRREAGGLYPLVAIILGNDDPRREEGALQLGERRGLWRYIHKRTLRYGRYTLYGYACIPPSPFPLKDWERYDVSRYLDVGTTDPTTGWRSTPVDKNAGITIQEELSELSGSEDLGLAVFLFHVPPYGGDLDLADVGGRMVDHAPVDEHVGSIAVRRFIEDRQPYLTLHGHAHESTRLSGRWRERIGRTWCFSAAYEGPELAVVRFDLQEPAAAERLLL